MATAAEIFRLTRRNVHQLPDMRTIVQQTSLRPSPALTSLELPVLRRASPSPSSVGQLEWSRSRPLVRRSPLPTSRSHSELDGGYQPGESYRLTRTMSELPRTTRSYFSSSSPFTTPFSSGTSSRHHSLVGMRTYYAFGARSAHLLDRNLDHSSSLSLSTYGLHGSSSPSAAFRDTSYTPSTLRRPYQPSLSPISPRVDTSSLSSSSALDRYYSAKSKSSGYSSSSSKYTPSSSKYTPSSSTYTPSSTTYTPYSSTYTPSSAIASSSSPSSYRSTAYHRTNTAYSGSTATSFQSASSSRPYLKPFETPRSTSSTLSSHDTKMAPTRSAVPQIVEHVSVSSGKGESSASQSASKRTEAEWQSLSDRNKALEQEVEQLKKLLREKERQETELKRRLLETAAEAKVWQNKYEQMQNQNPQVIHIREPGEGSALSEELAGKLDNATEKLAKLDPFREIALLQTEMEDALKEITEKPV